MIYYHGDPNQPPQAGETYEQYEARTGVSPVRLEGHLMEKWGVIHLANPADDAAPCYYAARDEERMPPYYVSYVESPFEVQVGKYDSWLEGRLLVAGWPKEIDGAVHVFAFDLRYPIPDQLKAARDTLMEMQKEAKNPPDSGPFTRTPLKTIRRSSKHQDGLLATLRILDALWSQAGRDEICDALWGRLPKQCVADHDAAVSYRKRMDQRITDALGRARRLVICREYREMLKWSQLPPSSAKKPGKKTKSA